MSKLNCKTRGNSSPQGKSRVWFCAHPLDYKGYFEPITDEILAKQNCAIYYDTEPEAVYDETALLADLREMQLFVMPVTSRLLYTDNRAIRVEFAFAIEHHIPVLPLMQEDGLVERFNEVCGNLQFLDKRVTDVTAIDYDEKLEKYLSSVLIGDELAAKVRAAFDAYIFLSYRKKDRAHAQELMRLIHRNEFCRDIAIWYDEFLTPGENFNDAIGEALQKSELFALAVTPNLVNEPNYVMTVEYPMACKAGKTILPAELVPTDRTALEQHYESIPACADAHDGMALSGALMRALQRIAIRENDNDPQHNFFIGLAYLGGIDVEVDHARALSLITSAAEAELPEAIEKLVTMYRNGEGVDRNYETAIAWQEKLVEVRKKEYERTGEEDDARIYVGAIWILGDDIYELQRIEWAEQVYLQMLTVCETMRKEKNFDWIERALSGSYNSLGNIKEAQGKPTEAEEFFRKGLDVREALARESGTTEARCDLAISYQYLCDIKQKQCKFDEAEYYCIRALELNETLAKEMPTVETKRNLAVGYGTLGDILSVRGKNDEAEEYIRRALELSEALTRELQTVDARMVLAASCGMMGSIKESQSKFDEAETYFQRALALYESVVLETGDFGARNALAGTYRDVGNVKFLQDDLDEAGDYYHKALELRETLMKETGTVMARYALKSIYATLGEYYKECGLLDEAANYYSKSVTISDELSRETEIVEGYGALSCYKKLGDIMGIQGKLDESEYYYEKAVNVSAALAAEKGTAEAQHELSVNYETLGDIKELQDKHDEAEKCYRKCLELYEILADKVETVEAYDELAISCYKVGMFAEDGYRFFKRALEIWTHLSEQCPDQLEYQLKRDVAKGECMEQEIKVERQRGNVKKVRRLLVQVLDIWTVLCEKNPEEPELAQRRDAVKKQLADC